MPRLLTAALMLFVSAALVGCGGGAEKGPAVPPTKVYAPPPTNEIKEI